MKQFEGHPDWDFRAHPSNAMCFRSDGTDLAREDVRQRAFLTLRDTIDDDGAQIEAALWALARLSQQSEKVATACDWFRVAAAYSEDSELRRAKCHEAYGMLQHAFRICLRP